MLTSTHNIPNNPKSPITSMLIPPWITPTMYACYRSEPLKGSCRSGFDSSIYKKLYYPKQEIVTDSHIYTSTSNSFCTKGFPVYDRYKESYNQNPQIIDDVKSFGTAPLKRFESKAIKSCCN
jgi:hypothetical protein